MTATTTRRSAGIIGLGPVGMILANHLKKAGWEVIVCDNDRIKVNQIHNEGIVLDGAIKSVEKYQEICHSAEELLKKDPDYVFVALKTYQVPQALGLVPPGCRSVFISAQNGIDTEQLIARIVGEERTIRMVINFAGNLLSPNSVKVTFFNPPNYLAALGDQGAEHARAISSLLSDAGLTTKAVSTFDLTHYAWEKTILNAALSPLCGIGRFTMAEAMEFADTVELVEQLIGEAVEVAEAEKIRFSDDFIRNCLRYLRKGGAHYPSLAGDLMNNRNTEIDHMNGKIVEYGRKHYIKTPLHLSMVNMVKAITRKNAVAASSSDTPVPGSSKNMFRSGGTYPHPKGACYMGIDLGSAYTKFTVVDSEKNVVFRHMLRTLNRDKVALTQVVRALNEEFPIESSCATGYGRKTFPDSDIIKTEINCAAVGVQEFHPGEKNIVDIGGEDIKVIRCDAQGKVENFYLNDKCAAGTGAFLVEIAERAGIDLKEMSRLAGQSAYEKELNSFCTVFAKTEIMNWIFEGQPIENIAKGIYLSIGNRIAKMRIDTGVPVVMIGGVTTHHPFIRAHLAQKLDRTVIQPENAQYVVSLGAALLAREHAMQAIEKRNQGSLINNSTP